MCILTHIKRRIKRPAQWVWMSIIICVVKCRIASSAHVPSHSQISGQVQLSNSTCLAMSLTCSAWCKHWRCRRMFNAFGHTDFLSSFFRKCLFPPRRNDLKPTCDSFICHHVSLWVELENTYRMFCSLWGLLVDLLCVFVQKISGEFSYYFPEHTVIRLHRKSTTDRRGGRKKQALEKHDKNWKREGVRFSSLVAAEFYKWNHNSPWNY